MELSGGKIVMGEDFLTHTLRQAIRISDLECLHGYASKNSGLSLAVPHPSGQRCPILAGARVSA